MVYGVGYLGDGEYRSKIDGETTRQYECWKSMMRRCYSQNTQNKQPIYIGRTVVDEWHNFQNFAKWYDENFYEIKGQETQLDKDILIKGSKIYSPETCVFVPHNINKLFTKSNKSRNGLPIGVCTHPNSKKYLSSCSNGDGKKVHLGMFENTEEAFIAYKIYKEKLITDIADKYKDVLPNRLYNALTDYRVDIND